MNTTSPTNPRTTTIVDLYGAIETPENVVLTYRLAGPALRMWAYLIDFIIRVVIVGVTAIAAAFMEFAIQGIPLGIFFLVWFLMEWGYFALLEGFFRGKTIGKHALSLRVIQEEGYPIGFWSALLRNFLRAADFLPFFYAFGFIAMMFSGKFRRLGDLAAGTVVIEERKVGLPREPIILEKIQPLSRTDIGTYVPPPRTLAMIEEFLERRFVLTHQRGHEIAAILAGVLAKKLDFGGEASIVQEYPMAFLARVYVTFHQSLVRDDEGAEETAAAGEPHPATAGV